MFGRTRLSGAVFWRLAFMGFQGLSSLLLLQALAHTLPREAFAACALALGILVIAQALGDFGLSQAAVSVLPARAEGDDDQRRELAAGAARVFFAGSAIALALAAAMAVVAPDGSKLPVLLIAPAAAAAVIVAGSDGVLRSQGEFRRPVVLVVITRVAAFAGVPAAGTGSAAVVCAAISGGTVIGVLPAFIVLLRTARAGQRGHAGAFALASLPIGLSQLFVVAGARLNTVVLGVSAGAASAAVFEGSWRVYQLMQYALGGVATAVAPFISDALGRADFAWLLRLQRLMMAVLVGGGTILALAFIALRGPLCTLLFASYGPEVARAVLPLLVITPLTLAGIFAGIVLAARNRTRRVILIAFAVGALVNAGLLVVVLPTDTQGAVAACTAGLVVANLIMLVRYLQCARDWKRSAARVGTVGAMLEPVT